MVLLRADGHQVPTFHTASLRNGRPGTKHRGQRVQVVVLRAHGYQVLRQSHLRHGLPRVHRGQRVQVVLLRADGHQVPTFHTA